jgi:hypothetical protein
VRFFVLAWWLMTAWAACSYNEPSYQGVVFSCDAEHACPTGSSCVDGKCSGGSAQVGVLCGSAVCPGGKSCCEDFVNAPRCIGAGEVCTGSQLECDGAEDCAGERCCFGNSGDADCKATCAEITVCHTNVECGGAAPNCCALPAPFNTLKGCQATPCKT